MSEQQTGLNSGSDTRERARSPLQAAINTELTYQLRQKYASARAKGEPVIVVKKPGRNQPCPCGSGKKFKRCKCAPHA